MKINTTTHLAEAEEDALTEGDRAATAKGHFNA